MNPVWQKRASWKKQKPDQNQNNNQRSKGLVLTGLVTEFANKNKSLKKPKS